MPNYQQVLLNQLSAENSTFSKKSIPPFIETARDTLGEFTSSELAHLYVDVGFLQASLAFLIDQHWLEQKKVLGSEINFHHFIGQYFSTELSPREYLHTLLQTSSLSQFKVLEVKSHHLEKLTLERIKSRPFSEQKNFSIRVLHLLSDLFEFESQLHIAKERRGEYMGFSMYRTFDSLDEIFKLNYLVDSGMKTDLNNTERLYEGAGVGVQSGYSTLLTALRHLNPSQGSRFIDLGSGYGRLGIVIGLLRPDIDFQGYEYVSHRVDIAMSTVENLALQNHVHFYAQDLSSKEFQIPDAEIYYLYDPFCEETYRYVLSQLVSISQRQKISIATKGNARGWLMETQAREGWPPPQEFHSGNLCLFSSK